MNEAPNRWLVFAREDLRVAEVVFDEEATDLQRLLGNILFIVSE